jgi:hypothetical protein
LSILVVIFNTSLSWIYYITNAGNHSRGILGIFTNTDFASFGPYDGKLVSAFWTLNIYTNQRHLGFSFLLMFLSIFLVIYPKKKSYWFVSALIIGIMPWVHKAMLLFILVIFGFAFFSLKEKRIAIVKAIVCGGFIAFPGIMYLSSSGLVGDSGIRFVPGFLYRSVPVDNLGVSADIVVWLVYWLFNLGLLPLSALFGWLITMKRKLLDFRYKLSYLASVVFDKRGFWFWVALVIFAIANLFRFAPDIATNHKLVNFSIYLWGIYGAYFFYYAFKKSALFGKILSCVLFFYLILGGFFDFFPILNDIEYRIGDVEKRPVSVWIEENTDPGDVFFNTTYDTLAVSLTGRKIYYGWDYFAWGLGYDTFQRSEIMRRVIESPDTELEAFCNNDQILGAKYIFHSKSKEIFIELDSSTDNFRGILSELYEDEFYVIYDLKSYCLVKKNNGYKFSSASL